MGGTELQSMEKGLSRRSFLKQTASAAAVLSASGLGAPGAILDAVPFEATATSSPAPRPGAVSLKLALAGDTMMGRGVADALRSVPPTALFSAGVVEVAREADLFVLNLECCVSTRGEPWPMPGKPFFFRAPPAAVDALVHLGVDCVTLANNHALDFGYDALLDTFAYLDSAGVRWVGAGPDRERARSPVRLEARGFRLAVVGATDHPRDYAARPDRPGVAFADLRKEVPEWLLEALSVPGADAVLLTPHWGPNMTAEPPPYVRRAAEELAPRAALIAGHSAHVFHGVAMNVLYDLGDFLDDYATDPVRRNDLGLFFLVTLEATGPVRLEAVPLSLDYCHTRLADGGEAAWIRRRFRQACEAFDTEVREESGRLIVEWRR